VREAALLEHFFELAEFLRSGVVAATFGHAPPKPNNKTQFVLEAVVLRLSAGPPRHFVAVRCGD
ncbi:MAG: hypothetical protein WA658_16325, partial [Candidatus Acidiferrales bacterium]